MGFSATHGLGNPTPARRAAARRALARACAPALLVLVLSLCAAPGARAQAENLVYGVDFLTGNRVSVVDTAAGTAAPVGSLAFPTASGARRPTNGRIYHTEYSLTGTSTNRVAVYDPATNTNAVINNTGLSGVTIVRMAFRADDVLYAMATNNRLYTVANGTGAYTSVGVITLAGGGALQTSTGGDIAFSATNVLYLLINGDLYTVNIATRVATPVGDTLLTNPTSLAFGPDGFLYACELNLGGNSTLHRINPATAATTAVGAGVGMGITDLASSPRFADLSITKMASGAFVAGTTANYTLSVTNAGPHPATPNVTITDTLPAGVTYSSFTGAGWSCSAALQVVTCVRNSALTSGATSSLTLTVLLASNVSATVVNSASVSSNTIDPNYANNTESETTAVTFPPDLTITKTHSGNFTRGQALAPYTITVTNAGSGPTTAAITVSDTLPAGLAYDSFSGAPWSCGAVLQVVTCTRTTPALAAGASSSFTLYVNVATNAPASVTNTASVSTTGDANSGNNSASDPTTVNGVPDLRIAKTHAGNFTVGVNGTYTLTARNEGTASTSGTITVTDNLPTGLTVAAVPAPAGWDCSTTVIGSSTLTCTSVVAIAAGATSTNTISLSVAVAPAAFAASPVTNVASISGGGEPAFHNGNNSASDVTTINGAPDLTVTKTHSGNFTRGTTGSYTITVANAGTASTSGTITVTDNLPAGLTVAAVPAPAGWNCSTTVVGGSTAVCTSVVVIAAGATSTNTISLSVNVAQTAAASVTNAVSVSGGGENNTGNNSASDPTTVVSLSDLSLTKVVTTPGSGVGSRVTFTLTLANAGPTHASGVAVTDQLPAGLSYFSSTPAPGTTYNGTTGVWAVPSLQSGQSVTLVLVANINVVGALTNAAQVTASDQPDPDSTPNNNNAAEDDQASATLNVAPPLITLCKTFPGQTCTPPPSLPPQPPGAEIIYLIHFTNGGGSPAQNLVVLDRVPTDTEFKVGSASLNLGTTGIPPATPQIQYTNVWGAGGAPNPPDPNDAAAWSYVPTGAYDPQVTFIRLKLNADVPINATGYISFVVRIK